MPTCRELYLELEKWETYSPNNFSSSILKQGKINETKRMIQRKINVSDHKETIIKMVDGEK